MPLIEVADGVGFWEEDQPERECPLGCLTLVSHPNEGPYTAHRKSGLPYCEAARAGRSASLRRRARRVPPFKYTKRAKEDVDACVRNWAVDTEIVPIRVEHLRAGWCVSYMGAWRRVVAFAHRGGQAIINFFDGPQVTLADTHVVLVFRQEPQCDESQHELDNADIEASPTGVENGHWTSRANDQDTGAMTASI